MCFFTREASNRSNGSQKKIDAGGIRKGILVTPYEQATIREKMINAGFDIVFEEVSGNTLNVIARRPDP